MTIIHMKKLLHAICAVIVATASCAMSRAQNFATASVDPVRDSANIAAMKARLDSVRLAEGRPVVALVLSGGGAKGAAHIGVLRCLEELDIPVDAVLGTSMGGLVGGMYSLGYPATYLDSLIRSINWETALSDAIPTGYISYRDRRLKEKFLISIPFGSKDLTPLTAGYREGKDKLLRSGIPDGLVTGLNVGNILSSVSVGYQDSTGFDKLPIPFCSVASDIVSGQAKYWMDGDVTTAMRSTMSIPLLFSPVRVDGMVLIDGGTRNNFPTDVAREMGADYIIGVELGNGHPTADDIGNIVDVVMPIIDMLGKEAFNSTVKIPDLLIKPDMEGFDILSFTPEAIDTILQRGYDAAKSHAGELLAIREKTGGAHAPTVDRAVDINKTPVLLAEVRFEGMKASDAAYIGSVMDIKPGDRVDREKIEDCVARMFSTGAFRGVSYKLLGTCEPYTLVFETVPAPMNTARLSVRADSEELVNIMFGVSIGSNKIHGTSLEIYGKTGQSSYMSGHFQYHDAGLPTLNADLSFGHVKGDLAKVGKSQDRFGFYHRRAQLYVSDVSMKSFDIRGGLRNDYFKMTDWLSSDGRYANILERDNDKADYMSLFASARAYTMDSDYFPSRGISGGVGYEWVFVEPSETDYSPEHVASLDYRMANPLGGRVTMICSVYARSIFNSNHDLQKSNLIGGVMQGRYMDQQIPFCGFKDVAIVEDNLVSAEVALQTRIGKNHYVTAKLGSFVSEDKFKDMFVSMPEHVGASLGYGFNSIAGPIRFDLMWSNYTRRVGAYLSFGYDF